MLHPLIPVDTGGSAYAKDVVTISCDYTKIRNGPPSFVSNSLLCEIGRVIMVSSQKNNPVVRLAKPVGDMVIDLFIISRFIKTKSAISRYDEQRVLTLITDTEFVNQRFKVSMDIPGNNYLPGFRIIE